MSRFMLKRLAFGVIAAVIVGVVSQLATAQAPSAEALFTLGNNDTNFVDKTTFTAIKGNGVRGNRTATLEKLGAKEVSDSAIIHRSGKKHHIVRGTPPANATPQPKDGLHDWCPTCTWYEENRGSY
jgi:hypothetical protein